MKEIIKKCPSCACDTLHLIKIGLDHFYADCYSCDYLTDTKIIARVSDNQITNRENPTTIQIIDGLDVVKRIPIEIWSEHAPIGSVPKGSRTYIVTQNIKKEIR